MVDQPRPPSHARLLIVEDEEVVRDLLRHVLTGEGYEVAAVGTGEAALRALSQELYHVVLVDLNLPGLSGLDLLVAAPEHQPEIQIIVMTGFGSVDTAVEAMRRGAYDYVTKPFHPDDLLLTVARALREANLRREASALRQRAGGAAGIIGSSAVIQRLVALIRRIAPTRATVLVTGETGTGKELVARAIHDLSDRSQHPFVAVQCSALSESLLESELFGHVKGSFTGAIANRRGLIEEAHGGTLFLDEISTISPAMQVKLLRVLQERRIQRVGGGGQISVDFRLIAASNVDLAQEVAAGRFRQDLYYRLNVFQLRVPPLRERTEDIPLLADVFRVRAAHRNAVEAPEFAAETVERLMAYDWPGNVRQLENFVERAVILYAGARAIPFHLPAGAGERPEHDLLARAHEERWTLARLEKEYILGVLAEQAGHKGRAADRLGIDRRTLYRKLREFHDAGSTAGESIPPD